MIPSSSIRRSLNFSCHSTRPYIHLYEICHKTVLSACLTFIFIFPSFSCLLFLFIFLAFNPVAYLSWLWRRTFLVGWGVGAWHLAGQQVSVFCCCLFSISLHWGGETSKPRDGTQVCGKFITIKVYFFIVLLKFFLWVEQ